MRVQGPNPTPYPVTITNTTIIDNTGATGTGLYTHRDFAAKVRERLTEATGLEIRPPEDPFEAQGNRDALLCCLLEAADDALLPCRL